MKSEVVTRAEERKVIVASSLVAILEWADIYLFAALAPILAARFFPSSDATAGLLAVLAIYAAGFVARPFGALVWRRPSAPSRLVIMGLATGLLAVLPTDATIGAAAPALLLALRVAHGLALGAETGAVLIGVAERVPNDRRGTVLSWIPVTATVGAVLALLVTGLLRWRMAPEAFEAWGWRLPALVAPLLTAVAVPLRIRVGASPLFARLESAAREARAGAPQRPDVKLVLLALFGATAGQGVVWYTAHFYALFFLQHTLRVDPALACLLVGVSLIVASPFFVLFGKLSDRIGRLKIILAGCLLAALTYVPLFRGLTHYVNPAVDAFPLRDAVTAQIELVPATLLLFVLALYVTMVSGPITAFLVELFPTKLRGVSLAIPSHLGNGWFGGLLPLAAVAIVASAGDVYRGLRYPIGVAVSCMVVGAVFLRETPKNFDVRA